ncbi:hypothetical protein CHS0354_018633 [Potamilus streckersoni]|uniref:Uncharacterized protein n=1 Tax=Potamilus streckersoni TaxID=2493646 RepID=A0AAE0VYE9_9BIVA|nr:hypothetical protein CHS0354_018633 [Potamilus streckersoni]
MFLACVFPTDLVGMWSSSDGGQLVITGDSVNDYRINLTVMLKVISFKCSDLYQGKYILKSRSTFLFNTFEFDAYLCVEFYKISNTKFTYQLSSVVDPSLNERVVTRFAGNIPALADICNRPAPYEEETLITLDKIEDSQITAFETPVPTIRTTGANVQLHHETNTKKAPDEYAPLIGGVVAGVLVIGALAVMAAFCYCRQKSPMKSIPSKYMINFTSSTSVLQKEHTEPSNKYEETKVVH